MSDDLVVHVIDDDEAVRESIAFLLDTADLTARTWPSAVGFLEQAARAPGVIVTDVRMPVMNGVELARRLQTDGSPDPVIVITGHADVPLAVEAMKHGAADFLEKPFDDDLLLGAVKAALADQAVDSERQALCSQIAQRLAQLSARERQVLDGLVAGHPNKTIAYDLGISPRTIEIYRANVMTKMEAGSLSELVRMALTAGVLGKAKP